MPFEQERPFVLEKFMEDLEDDEDDEDEDD